MKKRMLACLLAVLLMVTPAMAYTENQQNTADALNHLELFLGTGTSRGYDLDAKLNRNQGVILLVRMLGKEYEAQNTNYSMPFKDVPSGAKFHVAYAYANGIVNGYTSTAFGGSDTMTDKMFLALSLRALGYTDKGENPDFQYSESRQMAYKIGLVDDPAYDSNFTRGEAVEIFWRILKTEFKDQEKTLGDQLIEQGVITKAELQEASDIQKNGKPEESTSGSSSSGNSSSSSGGSSSGSGSSAGDISTDETTGGGTTDKAPGDYTWEEYLTLSPEKQDEFFLEFEDPMDFIEWKNGALAEYNEAHPSIEIKPGDSIDLGDIIGK